MKNFVKLIEQVHAQRYMKVLTEITTKKLPVAYLSIAPIAQALDVTKNLRAQGLNIATLFVVDNIPPPESIRV